MPSDLPLHKFCYKGNTQDAKEEIENGVDVNIPGAQQRTPLHKAVGGSHADIVDLLLKAGALPEVLDKGGKTPLHWAALVDSVPCAKILLEQGKADINAKTKSGATCCHLAAEDNKLEVLAYFIEMEADGDALNNKGLTPFDVAKKKGHKEAMKVLRPNSGGGCSCIVS